MVSWNEFASSAPRLANVGVKLLFQHGVGLAYLATVSANGAPRLHPVSPILSSGRLYVFIATSAATSFRNPVIDHPPP